MWSRSIISCDIPTRSHMGFTPFYLMRRRKEDESTYSLSTLQQQRFELTEITFSLIKNRGYIRSSLGDMSVLVHGQ